MNSFIEKLSKTIGRNLSSEELEFIKQYYLRDSKQLFTKHRSFLHGIHEEDSKDNSTTVMSREIKIGGLLFTEDEYVFLQTILLAHGAAHINIIEDLPEEGGFNFQFPFSDDWEDLMRGGIVSLELFTRPVRNYYVFSDDLVWAKYVNNDVSEPYEIWKYTANLNKDFSVRNVGKL